MTCTQAVLSLLLFTPCNDGGGPSMDIAIAEALANPSRLESDRLKDALRRPDQILAFFEISPGMNVLDMFSGGGYYTEILSSVVGSKVKSRPTTTVRICRTLLKNWANALPKIK